MSEKKINEKDNNPMYLFVISEINADDGIGGGT